MNHERGNSVTEISFLTGELVFAGIWLLCRTAVWIRQGKIDWKREAALLLMAINLAVLIRFVFFPFFTVEGKVQPLVLGRTMQSPVRFNLVPFVLLTDYDVKKEAVINIVGNVALFIPTGILLPILYPHLRSFRKTVLIGAGISLAIELIQLLFPNSTSDVDDLLLNTLGVVLGWGIYSLFRRPRSTAEKSKS